MTSRKAPRWLLACVLLSLLAMIAGLAGLDDGLLDLAQRTPDPLGGLVALLDHFTLKILWDGMLPALLLAAGLVLRKRPAGRALLYTGSVQAVTVALCDGAKPVFGRLRPPDQMAAGGADQWFAGGYSFLSGHTGFYAGLVFPLVLLFPRAWPLLALPLLVAAQRILSFNHHLGDVAGSLLVASLVAWGACRFSPWAGAGSARSTSSS